MIDPNSSFDIPIDTNFVADKTSLTWMERMIETEEQRLKAQEDLGFSQTQRNEKDDTSS